MLTNVDVEETYANFPLHYVFRNTGKETRWLYQRPGGQWPASHRGDPGSLPGQFTFVFCPSAPVLHIIPQIFHTNSSVVREKGQCAYDRQQL